MSLRQLADTARPRQSQSRHATMARAPSTLALLVALLIPTSVSTVWGQAPAGTAAPKAPPAVEKPAPVSIPVPEVARRAEEVGKQLRDIEALIVPGPVIDGIAQ